MNRLCAATLLACCCLPLAHADYFATTLDPVTFNPASADVLRLDEQTGLPVPGFDFQMIDNNILALPSSMTIGPDGFLYVSDAGTGVVARVDPQTGDGAVVTGLPPLSLPPDFIPTSLAGLEFTASGTLLVAGPNTHTLYEFNLAAQPQLIGQTALPVGVFPTGLAIDNDGSVLVTEIDGGAVRRIDDQGQVSVFIAAVPGANPSGLSSPFDILPTDDGRYWVTDIFGNTLQLYDAGGSAVGSAIDIPPADPPPGLSNSPSGISFDSEGNILLASYGAGSGIGSLFRLERPAGDFNGDMLVDADDYNLWRSRFGQAPIAGNFDGNGDGVYDAADYTVWRDTFGQTAQFATISGGASFSSILQYDPPAASLGTGAAVPEPSTVLLTFASLGLAWSMRKRFSA